MIFNLRNSKGAALVEFAMVVTILFILLFGIIDFGWLIKDYLAVNQAAREGSRSAAVGETTTAIVQRVLTSAPITGLSSGDISLHKQTSGGSAWTVLGDSGSQNNAVPGDYVRVGVTYQHNWITGFFASSSPIHGEMTSRRE